MSNGDIAAVVCMLLLIGIVAWAAYDKGFERGQIKYANGEKDYVLMEKPDGERIWVHKNIVDNFKDAKIIK